MRSLEYRPRKEESKKEELKEEIVSTQEPITESQPTEIFEDSVVIN